jgi:predicted Fe-Mo cluster-binding NifX family protein
MKAAISSTGEGLGSVVDGRFGRAHYFVIIDTDDRSLQDVIDNESSIAAQSGAGVRSAQQLSSLGVDAVLTGNIGPKALQVLEAAGIVVYTGVTGTVAEAAASLHAGKLESVHSGQALPAGQGLGRGMRYGQDGTDKARGRGGRR